MIVKLLISGAAAYGLVVALVYFFQDRLLYIPYRSIEQTPAVARLAFEDVRFSAADGTALHGWYVPAPDACGTLLFCHGNAGNISHRIESILLFHRLGLNVFIFDYRGYGESRGRPSEQGTYQDASAAWQWLTEVKTIDPARLVIFGRSLGGAVAAELAVRRQAAGLILESAFTSYPDIGHAHYPWLPVRMLAKYRYANIEKVSRLVMPVLVIHSPDDEIVPFSHGRVLYAACAEPKQFLEIRGGHNDGFLLAGEIYTGGTARFLESCLP